MFRVEVNNGMFVLDYDENEVTTVGGIKKKFTDDNKFRYAAGPTVRDTSQNSIPPDDTPTIEGRIYAMDVWITQQLDENNEPIKKSVYI